MDVTIEEMGAYPLRVFWRLDGMTDFLSSRVLGTLVEGLGIRHFVVCDVRKEPCEFLVHICGRGIVLGLVVAKGEEREGGATFWRRRDFILHEANDV